MASDPEAERILSEPYEPTEADRHHQERVEAARRWPHEGRPPIGQISEDASTAKLVRHNEAKQADAAGDAQ